MNPRSMNATIADVLRSILFLSTLYLSQTAVVLGQEGSRVWTDKTGRFQVTGTLSEVRDDSAWIKTNQGKVVKIPVVRLSQKDQAYLSNGDNPFEVMAGEEDSQANDPPSLETQWTSSVTIDWAEAHQLLTVAQSDWKVPEVNHKLDFKPQRAALPKKHDFHERLHPLVVNTQVKRAVVGQSVSFAVPQPVTRLSLVDLVSGKSIQYAATQAEMRPLALLDDGNSVLMVGANRNAHHQSGDTKDQLQWWRLKDKQVLRSATWVPYEDEGGLGKTNASIVDAAVLDQDRVLTLSDTGHVVLWNLNDRQPIWHARLNHRNFAMKLSNDRKALALFDNKTLMVVDPESAEILGSTSVSSGTATGWVRIAWSPMGDKVMVSSLNDLRVLATKTGQWIQEAHFPSGSLSIGGLGYAREDYAWLNHRLLVHVPSRIQVCHYQNAASAVTIGGVSIVLVSEASGRMLLPVELPQTGAVEMLQQAESDPDVFLIHPGVSVAIDVSSIAPEYRETIRKGLEKSALAAGYEIDDDAEIKLVAFISEPKQASIRYIAAGSYSVTKYTSSIKMRWNEKDVWSQKRSNIPDFLQTKRGETMEEALDKASDHPNTVMFQETRFPKFLQKPSDSSTGHNASNALMSAQFTLQGLVDTP